MKKLLSAFAALLLIFSIAKAQTVDIIINNVACGDFEVKLKPSVDLTSTTLTNIQFTVKWPETSPNSSLTAISSSFVTEQGSTAQSSGYNYLTFAGVDIPVNWTANTEYEILTFSFDQAGTGTGDFVIMPSGDGYASINTLFYVEWLGSDVTGSITNNASNIDLGKPAISLGSNPSVCQGETSADITYSGTTYSPDLYSIDFDAVAEAENFVDVTDASLPSSPISITVPGDAAAGTYNATLTVKKSANGCESDGYSIAVTVNALPIAGITNNSGTTVLTCATTEISVTATGGASYSWDGGATPTTANNTFNATGTYTVTVTDANGCTDIESITLTQDLAAPSAQDIASATTVLTCTTTSITLTASATDNSGTDNLTYSWDTDPVQTTAAIDVTAAGTYTVTITDPDNGCSVTDQVEITEDLAAPSGEAIAYATTVLNCTTTSITLTASATDNSGTDNLTYSWDTDPVQTTAAIDVTAAGTYTVTITDPDNGCSVTDQVEITEDLAAPSGEAIAYATTVLTCTTTSITLTASATDNSGTDNLTYSWDTDPVQTTAAIDVTAAGTYTVTITDPDNGCSVTDQVEITEDLAAPSGQDIASATTVLTCTTTSITLTASATDNSGTDNLTYSWDTDPVQTTAAIDVTAAGTYTVTITDPDNGCSVTDQVEITEDLAAPSGEAIAYATTVLTCTTTSITLTASATDNSGTDNLTYSWDTDPVQTTAAIDVTAAGTYTVTITDPDNGCSVTDQVEITEDLAAPSGQDIASATTVLTCTTTSITLTASATDNSGTDNLTYSWDTDPVQTTAAIDVTAAGTYTVTITDPDNGCSVTDQVEITEDLAAPSGEAIAYATTVLTCTTTSITLTASATDNSGTDNLTYSWDTDPVQTTAAIDVTAAGTYTVTITDPDNGCSVTDQVEITEDLAAPSGEAIAYATTVLTCTTTSITLTASATDNSGTDNLTYSWDTDPVQTTAAIDVTAAGTYTVTITDPDNGCSVTDQVEITEDLAAPSGQDIASATTVLTCTTTSITLTASATDNSGTDNLTYSWDTDPVQTTAAIDVTAAGTYTVTITDPDNGCSVTDQVEITEDLAAPSGEAIAYATTVLTCTTTSITLTASATDNSGTDNLTYSWDTDPVQTTAAIDVTAAGTYTVTITDPDNGCSVTDQVEITEDLAAPSGEAIAYATTVLTCTTTSITLTASATDNSGTDNLTYSWDTDPVQTTAAIDVTAAGTYTVTITDPDNGCSVTDQVEITEDLAAPSGEAIAYATTVLTCTTTSITLTASATDNSGTDNLTYSWDTDPVQTTAAIDVTAAGTYTVTITDPDNGCSVTDQVEITEDLAAPSGQDIASATTVLTCTTTSITLTASATDNSGTDNLTYSWDTDPVQTTAAIDVTAAGTYTVTITDPDNGCSVTDQVEITEDLAAPSGEAIAYATTVLTCTTTSITLTASATDNSGTDNLTYSWDTDPVQTTAAIDVTAAGTYTVTITDPDNGCSVTDQVEITEDLAAPSGEAIAYATTVLTCTTTSITLTASATDNSGTDNLTYSWDTDPVQTTAAIDVTAAGTYTVTITDPDNGCSVTDQVEITEDLAAPSGQDIASATTVLTCTTTSITLTASATDNSGTDNLTYSWDTDPVQTTAAIDVTAAGTYTVTITDPDNGCSVTDQVEITEDLAAPSGEAIAYATTVLTCTTTSITLTASATDNSGTDNLTYSWDTDPVQTTAAIDVTAAGTYTVTITDPDNGCSVTDQVEITEDLAAPSGEAIAYATTVLTCTTTSITLTASATDNSGTDNLTYSWDTDPVQTTAAIDVTAAGTYTVTITDPDNGCSVTDQVEITEDLAAPSGQDIASATTVLTCTTTSITLTASATDNSGTDNLTYSWDTDPVQTTAAIDVTAAGTYTVTITDPDNGCSVTDQVEITEDLAAPSGEAIAYATTVLTCTTTSITLTASATDNSGTDNLTYSWDTDPVQTTAAIDVTAAGTYTVTITDPDNGCSVTDQVEITEDNDPPVVSITGSTAICIGGTSQLSPTSGGTWISNNPSVASVDNTGLVTGLDDGDATFTFTQTSNGCSNTTNAITVNDLPNNTSSGFSGNTICEGEDGLLTFNAINTTFVETYTIVYSDGTNSWSQDISSDGDFIFNVAVNPVETTSYSLISITNGNGCVRTIGFGDGGAQITVNALPNPPIAQDETVTYDGNAHSADATVDAGETVDWYTTETGGTTTTAPTGTNSGVYTAWAEARNTTTGCVSANRTLVTLTIEKVSLDLTVFLQGPYDDNFGTMNVDLYNGTQIPTSQPYNTDPWNYSGTETATPTASDVDWVLVELRSDASTMVARSAALLNEDGSLTARIDDVEYPSVVDGASYYVVIWHRNHLPVMTTTAQTVPVSSYDFSDVANLYGSNPAVELGDATGVYGMVAGDVTRNGVLQYSGPGNDRGPIIAKIVLELANNNINGEITDGYWFEDVVMNNNVLYIGTDNDRAPIIDNIQDLIGPELNNLYQSEVPGAVTGSKEQISNNGSFDLTLSQNASSVNVDLVNTKPVINGMIDNIQFTLAWNAGDDEIEELLQNISSTFMLSPQGQAFEYDGIMHQVYVSINPVELPEEINEGEVLTVVSFENPDWINTSNRLWIADNAWTNSNNGMYYVSVWGENNTGTIHSSTLSIDELSSVNNISIFPNPVNQGKVNIEIKVKQDEMLEFTIYDMYGKLIEQVNQKVYGNNLNKAVLEVDTFEPGVYLITILGSKTNVTKQIVIK